MPYIKQENRPNVDYYVNPFIEYLQKELPGDVDGQLNYAITRILKEVYPLRYYDCNRAMGMLECVKQEFYRTVVGPYEDVKIKENGNV